MYLMISMNFLIFSFMFLMFSILIFINKKILLINWLIYNYNSLNINFLIYIDWMSLMFISTVLVISSMVILYSMEYMELDKFKKRFLFLIISFISSMILMIISPNLISIILGWDGLGFSSFCLIIYYQNYNSYNSGMTTILMNRMGDICLILSISLMMSQENWNLPFLNKKLNILILILLTLTTMTKSAQIPFSSWLTKAMAAPTPISSLVHSSTLVTAGIYLMIRFYNIIPNYFFKFFIYIACFTMIYSSISANFEFDLKKIIALSTLSQLSIMFMTICLNQPLISFFHLISHAMFKSLLFLCSGIIIHNNNNNQDIRFISMNNYFSPYISMIFYLASLSLSGIPFLSGFYSKDLIIELFNMKFYNMIMFYIMFISMMLTMAYSARLIFYLMIKQLKMSLFTKNLTLSKMNFSIMLLILLTIFLGSNFNWLFLNNLNLIILNKKIKLMMFKLFIFSIIISILLINLYKKFLNQWYFLMKFFNLMFFLPNLMKKNKINMYMMNQKFFKMIDQGWIEYLMIKKKIILFNNLFFKFNNLNLNMFMIMFLIYCSMFMHFFF
uniref:NADH-ubiquinone oxidoreductase chain 5 n=1 Tax=Cardiochiles fuscipennis TaxID=69312 RepID=A0A0A6ZKP6_9HYME|nr:NADH dehydrogenase subunit 5 [Cardiochiles fuscipennis]